MINIRISTRFAVLLLGSAGVAACTLVLDGRVEDQCFTDADCVGRGPSFSDTVCTPQRVCTRPARTDGGDEMEAGPVDPIWGCVGNTTPIKIDVDSPIRVQWKFIGGLTELPLPNVKFKVCTALDTECVSPIRTGETGEDGITDVQLYKGFRGYMELSGGPQGTLQPALFYFEPTDHDVMAGPQETAVHLLAIEEFKFLLGSLGVQPVPEYGHIFGLAFDCGGIYPVAGVSVDTNRTARETVRYYTDENRTPSLEQLRTSSRGEAGYVNVPAGASTMTFFRGAQQLGAVTVIVRPQHITYAALRPM